MEPPHLSQPWKKSTSPSCKLKPKTPLHRYLVSCCDQTLSLQTLLPNPINKLRSFLESVSEIPLFCLNTMDPCRTPKLRDFYRIKKKIGEGSFGTVYLCTDMSDGKEYACKYVDKRRLSEEDYDNVIREIAIMKHLSAWKHPNVVQIKESYEDEKSVSLVMELCSGGDLFDRIRVNKLFTERESAQLVKNIVEGVKFCNSRGVMHRDLKPENLLFATSSDEGSEVLKVSDFGLSLFFKPGEIFRAAVGSPYYVAPEVLLQKYGPEVDVWSVGVILYIMLSSAPPFCAETAGGILNKVKGGTLNLESDPWPDISEGAKDLVSKMLNRDPKKRFTPQQVLDHPWIVNASS